MNELELVSPVFDITRGYLALFYTCVALFYTVRIITFKRKVGHDLVFHGQAFSANWWHHKLFGIFRVTIWMLCVWRWIFPALDSYLGLLPALTTPELVLLGDLMLALGFGWSIFTHLKMGRCWSSGIDPNGPEVLLTSGVYRWSRNPVYLGVLLSQLGFFFALPSLFSLLCLVVGVTVIIKQVDAEEQHLAQRFPLAYAHYKGQVRRWL